jgi:hypothetical protein
MYTYNTTHGIFGIIKRCILLVSRNDISKIYLEIVMNCRRKRQVEHIDVINVK